MGGAGPCRAPRLAGASCLGEEHGSQSIEFALALPFVVLTLVLLLHAALFASDLVAAHAAAFSAARVATIDDDAAVDEAAHRVAGSRPIEVEVDPPDAHRGAGDLVTATVRVRSAAFKPFGATVWVPARMTLRVERP